MDVEIIGPGNPQLAVVGAIHGDEPCGSRAINRFKEEGVNLDQAIKLIIANEEAQDQGVRYIDEDLNRIYDKNTIRAYRLGSENIRESPQSHERTIAINLLNEVASLPVLDLHSTVSQPYPFLLFQNTNRTIRRLANSTRLDKAIDISYEGGGFIGQVNGISIECGRKGSESAYVNAYKLIIKVLYNWGILDEDTAVSQLEKISVADNEMIYVIDNILSESDPRVYKIYNTILKPESETEGEREILAKNFNEVEEGDSYAIWDGEELIASDTFYPVLMSLDGYEKILGYKSVPKGSLSQYIT